MCNRSYWNLQKVWKLALIARSKARLSILMLSLWQDLYFHCVVQLVEGWGRKIPFASAEPQVKGSHISDLIYCTAKCFLFPSRLSACFKYCVFLYPSSSKESSQPHSLASKRLGWGKQRGSWMFLHWPWKMAHSGCILLHSHEFETFQKEDLSKKCTCYLQYHNSACI